MYLNASTVLGILIFSLSAALLAAGQSEKDVAIELYRSGDYKEAIARFEKIGLSGNEDYESALFLGASYLRAGQTKSASSTFLKHPKPATATATRYDEEVKITKRPFARFSAHLVSENEPPGFIKMAVELKFDGTVGFTFPFAATSKNFAKPGIEAAEGIKFRPAVLNGKPVTVIVIMEYRRN
jgi:hypothetical protein